MLSTMHDGYITLVRCFSIDYHRQNIETMRHYCYKDENSKNLFRYFLIEFNTLSLSVSPFLCLSVCLSLSLSLSILKEINYNIWNVTWMIDIRRHNITCMSWFTDYKTANFTNNESDQRKWLWIPYVQSVNN